MLSGDSNGEIKINVGTAASKVAPTPAELTTDEKNKQDLDLLAKGLKVADEFLTLTEGRAKFKKAKATVLGGLEGASIFVLIGSVASAGAKATPSVTNIVMAIAGVIGFALIGFTEHHTTKEEIRQLIVAIKRIKRRCVVIKNYKEQIEIDNKKLSRKKQMVGNEIKTLTVPDNFIFDQPTEDSDAKNDKFKTNLQKQSDLKKTQAQRVKDSKDQKSAADRAVVNPDLKDREEKLATLRQRYAELRSVIQSRMDKITGSEENEEPEIKTIYSPEVNEFVKALDEKLAALDEKAEDIESSFAISYGVEVFKAIIKPLITSVGGFSALSSLTVEEFPDFTKQILPILGAIVTLGYILISVGKRIPELNLMQEIAKIEQKLEVLERECSQSHHASNTKVRKIKLLETNLKDQAAKLKAEILELRTGKKDSLVPAIAKHGFIQRPRSALPSNTKGQTVSTTKQLANRVN